MWRKTAYALSGMLFLVVRANSFLRERGRDRESARTRESAREKGRRRKRQGEIERGGEGESERET